MRTIPPNWPNFASSQDYPAKCDFCGVVWPRSRLRKDGNGRLVCPDEGRGLSIYEAQQAETAFYEGLGKRHNASDGHGFDFGSLEIEHASRRETNGTTTTYDAIPEDLGAILNLDETTWGDIGDEPASLTDSIGSSIWRQGDPTRRATVVEWEGAVSGLKALSFTQSSEAWYSMTTASGEGGTWATTMADSFTLYAVVSDIELGYAYTENPDDADAQTRFVNDMFGFGVSNDLSFMQLGFTPDDRDAAAQALPSFRAHYLIGDPAETIVYDWTVRGPDISVRSPQVVWWQLNSSKNMVRTGSTLSDPVGTTSGGSAYDCFLFGSAFSTDHTAPSVFSRFGGTVGQIVAFSGAVSNTVHRDIMDYLHLKWGVTPWR